MKRQTYQPQKLRFPWKILLYALIIAYLFIDLYWLKGPLSGWIEQKANPSQTSLESFKSSADPDNSSNQTEQSTHSSKSKHPSKLSSDTLIASVNTIPITLGELDRGVAIAAYASGQFVEELSAWDRQSLYLAELENLIADKLIGQRSKLNPVSIDDYDEATELARFKNTFVSEERFLIRLRALGLSLDDLKEQLREKAARSAWIEDKIAHAIEVTEEETAAWFAQHRLSLTIPAQIKARHLFLNKGINRQNTRGAESKIRSYAEKLRRGSVSFESLIKTYSEDGKTKHRGGYIDWFSQKRIPPGFQNLGKKLFSLQVNKAPSVLESTLGWHLIQVTAKRSARPATLDEYSKEIALLLQNQKREAAVSSLLREIKKKANILYAKKTLQDYVGIRSNPAPEKKPSEK